MLFFFFSSRRRHTRYWRDWSSDVCSSDLRFSLLGWSDTPKKNLASFHLENISQALGALGSKWGKGPGELSIHCVLLFCTYPRSEERRVGKECRSRWSPYH